MRRISFFVVLIISLYSCSVKTTKIQGKYLDGPYIIKSEKNIAQVWDNMIDLFAQKGLSIKIIDRSSGLITSDKAKISWSRESQKNPGKLVTPDAWVVIDRVTYPGSSKSFSPAYVTGEWNVRIKANSDSTTNINVNLVNIQVYAYTSSGNYQFTSIKEYNKVDARSTGNFEKIIADYIK